jgi:hypothetical protein
MLIDSNGIDVANWQTILDEKGEESNLENYTNKMID